MVKEKKAGGQGVEKAALSDQHGQSQAFPADKRHALIIQPFIGLKELEAGQPAIEEEARDGEGAAPAKERVTKRGRGQQAGPDQAANNVHAQADEDGIEQVYARGIPEFAENIDGIVRPDSHATGKVVDVGQVKRQVAEVIRGLDF